MLNKDQILSFSFLPYCLLSQDQGCTTSWDASWPRGHSEWIHSVPWGFRRLLKWISERYPGIPIFVTENGCSVEENSVEDSMNDTWRQNYLSDYISQVSSNFFFFFSSAKM